jgi:metal-responsive CopG/Arc/MetJ family transcriptional regulator
MKNPDFKVVTVSISLPRALVNALDHEAEVFGISRSKLYKYILKSYFLKGDENKWLL